MKDDAQPVILDDPERIKALNHPLRRRILHRLRAHGPGTSTTIGEALGVNTGTTSYHLRLLEKYGFIEDVPERSTGRERWWRRPQGPHDIRSPDPRSVAPEDRPVLTELLLIKLAEDVEMLGKLPEAHDRDSAWVRLSRGSAQMTEEGIAAFFEAYIQLLHQHAHSHENAPPGARAVNIRLFTLPADDG